MASSARMCSAVPTRHGATAWAKAEQRPRNDPIFGGRLCPPYEFRDTVAPGRVGLQFIAFGTAKPEGNSMRQYSTPAPARPRKRTDRLEAGFTLVEILVVVTIIGLIMALVGPRVLNYLGESKVKTAKIQIDSFSSALDLFYLDVGRYPLTNEGLAALAQRPGNIAEWNGPYVRGGMVPNDPWGHPYIFRSPGERGPYEILSFGSDGQEGGNGTATDIASWQH
jgi:general secretion pathway protein G